MQEFDIEKNLVKDIKNLSMLLSRFKPADWNKFLDVVIKWTWATYLPYGWADKQYNKKNRGTHTLISIKDREHA